MKLQNVLRIMYILFLAFFACVSIGLSMDITPVKSSDRIANGLIINENTINILSDENNVETYSGMSEFRHRNDLLNFNTCFIETDDFSPELYQWFWKEL